MDIPRNPWTGYRATGAGSLAVELVTPAISSPPPLMFSSTNGTEAAAAVRVALPHLKYLDGVRRGYVVLDVTPTLMRADWYHSPTFASIRTRRSPAGASCASAAPRICSRRRYAILQP